MDPLGRLIRFSGSRTFKGKSRLTRIWLDRRDKQKKVIRVLPGGARILCDLSVPYEAMVYLEQEEEAELQVLRKLLRSGETFVDCGANVGIWSLVAASVVGTAGKVYSFEPNPPTFERLSRNLSELNSFSGTVRLCESALGSTEGELNFLADDAQHNISSVAPCRLEGTIRVPVTTLDQTLKSARVNGIKIDVEGYELEVLRGAKGLLEHWKPWLCVEFNTELAKVDSLDDWEVHRFLRMQGFRPTLFNNAVRGTSSYWLADSWKTKGYVNLFYSFDGGET